MAVYFRIRACKHRHDLRFYEQRVWVEIPIQNDNRLPTGNHYFPPDSKLDVITKYFCSLEKHSSSKNHCDSLIEDFSVRNTDWQGEFCVPNSYFQSKSNGDAADTSTYLLGLTQRLKY
jgi:hypothetical protein